MRRVMPFIFVNLSFVLFFVIEAQSRRAGIEMTRQTTTTELSAPEVHPALLPESTGQSRPTERIMQTRASRVAPALHLPIPIAETAPKKPELRRIAVNVQSNFSAGACFARGATQICPETSE